MEEVQEVYFSDVKCSIAKIFVTNFIHMKTYGQKHHQRPYCLGM